MNLGMFLYAWDLRDEGAAAIAGRLVDSGISSVSVATSYHAGKFLRPHGRSGKVFYPEDGTVYFRHDPSLYGRLKPKLAKVAEDHDALSELEKSAPDLRRVAWTVGLHNSRLGRENPDLVCRTAFGDPIWSSLCPSNPEVREYLAALCIDQARNAPVSEIAIEAPGFQTYRHNDHHEFELIELTDRAASLLGLCFCPSCRAGAKASGVDAVGLAARAQAELEAFFSDGGPCLPDLDDDPDWRPFLQWRDDNVSRLVADIRHDLPRSVTLAVIPTVRTPVRDCWREGADLGSLSRAADRVVVPIYQRGADATAAEIAETRRLAGNEAALGFILRPSWPTLETAQAVRQACEAARSASAQSVDFYNYGHLRLSSLAQVKALQA